MHVTPELDVAEEAHSRVGKGLAEAGLERLDLEVVRCHAVAQQAVRGRQAFEYVDLRLGALLEERFHGEQAGWS